MYTPQGGVVKISPYETGQPFKILIRHLYSSMVFM